MPRTTNLVYSLNLRAADQQQSMISRKAERPASNNSLFLFAIPLPHPTAPDASEGICDHENLPSRE